MPYIISNGELYHYGVPGMKWGVRKKHQAMIDAKKQRRAARKEYSKAFNKATTVWGAFGPNSKANSERMIKTAKAANAADQKYKEAKKNYKQSKKQARIEERGRAKAEKLKAKMAKKQYKDTIKQYAKEINAGESVIGRLYNKYTGADKIQAELKYAEERRTKSK